jgi:hypothetical protein
MDSHQILFIVGVGVVAITYFRLMDSNRLFSTQQKAVNTIYDNAHKERFGDTSLRNTGVRSPFWRDANKYIKRNGVGQYGLPCFFMEVPGGATLKLYGDPTMIE